jgi:hypothetical protein
MRFRNRSDRHDQESQLPTLPGQLDVDEADEIESAMFSKVPRRWEKVPDSPLGQIIAKSNLDESSLMGESPGQER